MKIIIQVSIVGDDGYSKMIKGSMVSLQKEYESTVVPHKGDYLVDSGFNNGHREVNSVNIDYANNEILISLERLRTFEDVESIVTKLKDHGWKKI